MTAWVQLRIVPPGSRPVFSRDHGAPSGHELRLPAGGEIRIGRRPGVDVELPYETVSLLHASLSPEPDGLALADLGSRNGTWIGGDRLAAGERRHIRPGESFRVANVEITLLPGEEQRQDADAPPAETTTSIARRLVADMFRTMEGGGVPCLRGEGGATLALSDAERRYLVGRGDDCALVLLDVSVSREHAAFERRWDGVFVIDLGSKNGVMVNGERIAGERRLGDGDRIGVGDVSLQLDDPQDRFLRDIEARPEVDVGAAEAASAEARARDPAANAEGVPAHVAVVAPQTEPIVAEGWLNARALLFIAGGVLLLVGCLLAWLLLAA